MDENLSKVIKYTLVILIGLILSYALFVQAQDSKYKFSQLEEKNIQLEQKIESLKTDNIVEDLKIEAIERKLNPQPVVDGSQENK